VILAESLALVTGAGGGIGRATSLELARQGARVLAVDIDADAAAKTAVECEAVGPEAHSFVCDVSDAAAVQALADDVHERWGPLQVLVNNAGVGMSGRLADMALDDWRWIRSINLDGVFHCCRAFGPAMVDAGRGHIINLSSGLAYTPRATEPAYVATKAAVLALSQSLRADWRPKGVGVTAICPGVVNTAIVDNTRFLGDQADYQPRITKVFRRSHKPEAVARAVVRSIVDDRIMVAVGWEAKLSWIAHRLMPLSSHQFAARRSL
jgi:2-hydroxycyclohexanecarboxyl-CoA dehydrogenase